jgi:hypothetical protein
MLPRVVTNAATLNWAVPGSGQWDTASPNWTGDATIFVSDNTQNVIFDNTAGGTITIASGMSPVSTTVSAASGTYIFEGGPIATGSLIKGGAGTLTLTGANTYPAPRLSTPAYSNVTSLKP